jgi:hypothetical protein
MFVGAEFGTFSEVAIISFQPGAGPWQRVHTDCKIGQSSQLDRNASTKHSGPTTRYVQSTARLQGGDLVASLVRLPTPAEYLEENMMYVVGFKRMAPSVFLNVRSTPSPKQ